MTDKYDLPFDMTEYTVVREAFDALPEAQLPAGLSAAALFARMDAQTDAPAKTAPAFDIRRLRRGMALAACGVLVVAAYVGLSQAGMLGGKTAVTTQDAAAPAASAAATTAAPEAGSDEEMFYMAGGVDADNGLGSGAPANALEESNMAESAEADAFAVQTPENKEALTPDAAPDDAAAPEENAADAMPSAPLLGAAPGLMPPEPDNIPDGYTLLANAAQGDPEAALRENTGLSFAQLQKAAMTGLDASLEPRLNSISVSDGGDGSLALDVQLFALVPADGGDGFAGTMLYRLLPAGDGYDLMQDATLLAHFTA